MGECSGQGLWAAVTLSGPDQPFGDHASAQIIAHDVERHRTRLVHQTIGRQAARSLAAARRASRSGSLDSGPPRPASRSAHSRRLAHSAIRLGERGGVAVEVRLLELGASLFGLID